MDSPDAIKNAVRQGLGISVVSKLSAAEDAGLGLFTLFTLAGERMARHLSLAHHKSRPLSPVSTCFMQFFLQHCQRQ